MLSLQDPDPFDRDFELFKIQNETLRIDSLKEVLKICIGDENQLNRCNAALLIAKHIHSMNESSLAHLREICIHAVLKVFFSNFPRNLKQTMEDNPHYFDQSNFIASKRTLCRLRVLNCIGILLQEDEFHFSAFTDYIDSLMIVLLQVGVAPCFQKAVLDILNHHLVANRRNRTRVETKFTPHVDALFNHISHLLANEEVPLATRFKESMVRAIWAGIHSFYSKWAPVEIKPTEARHVAAVVQSVSEVTPFSQFRHIFEGFKFVPAEPIDSPARIENEVTFETISPLIFPLRFPFEKDAILTNQSQSEDFAYFLQVEPHSAFEVFPSFGFISKDSSVRAMVNYFPPRTQNRAVTEISGQITIRNVRGTAIDTLQMKSFPLPAISVFPGSLSFGNVSVGTSRTLVFNITNILPCDCPCLIVLLQSRYASFFQVSNGCFILQSGETKEVGIQFSPSEKAGEISVGLLLLAAGIQLERITISAHAGDGIDSFDRSLVLFGNLGDTMEKRVMVKGGTHFFMTATSNEFAGLDCLNRSTGDRNRLRIQFNPALRGHRDERINLHFPQKTISFDANFFCGDYIYIPMKEVVFMPLVVGQDSSVMTSAINLYGEGLKLSISIPLDAPFRIKNLPASQDDSFVSYQVVFRNIFFHPLDIHFTAETPGMYHVPMRVQAKVHKYSASRTIFLNGVVVDSSVISPVNPAIELFYASRESREITFRGTAPPTNSVFQLDPPYISVRGSTQEDDMYQFVTLSNMSNTAQPYQIVLSAPFFTNRDAHGVLAPMSAMEIPIFLDVSDIDSGEVKSGILSVFDSKTVSSVRLTGVVDHFVYMETKGSELSFGRINILEKRTRRIIVRNILETDVIVEVKRDLLNLFEPSWTRAILKGQEVRHLDIVCASNTAGLFDGTLCIEYDDPSVYVESGKLRDSKVRRILNNIKLSVVVGKSEIQCSSDAIDFGDVSLGEVSARTISIRNLQPFGTRVLVHCPLSCISFRDKFFVLGPEESRELHVKYEPKRNEQISGFIDIVTDEGTECVPYVGSGGDCIIECTLIDVETKNKYIKNDYGVYDLGYISSGHPASKLLILHNAGDLLLNISNIQMNNRFINWRISEKDGFYDFQPWDKETPASTVKRPTTRVTERVPRAMRSRFSSSFGTPQETNIYCPPGARIPILLTFAPGAEVLNRFNLQGYFRQTMSLTLMKRKQLGKQPLDIVMTGNVQPNVEMRETLIEFGIVPINSKTKQKLTIVNRGDTSLSWKLVPGPPLYKPIAKYEPSVIVDPESYPDPFEVFPSSGSIGAKSSREIEVSFLCKAPQYDLSSSLCLYTENHMTSKTQLHGIGASAHFVMDKTKLDFGIVRVGTKKMENITIHNKGILSARYYIESSDMQFTLDPEQGVLEGNGRISLNIFFQPKIACYHDATLTIHVVTESGMPNNILLIKMDGEGSYPHIVILDKFIDFGTALYNIANIRTIQIENKGAADAHLSFTCHHASITMRATDGSEEILIPGKSVTPVQIVYTPSILEILDSKIFIRSSDNHGDYNMVILKGKVGIPKIVIEPQEVWDNLDFGICRTFTINEKQIKIRNEGNIPLDFKFELQLVEAVFSEKQMDFSDSAILPQVMSVTPSHGHLGLEEEQVIKFSFKPTVLAEYHYKIHLVYEFVRNTVQMTGSGGKSIIQVDSPLSYIDFHMTRLKKRSTKLISISNYGNLVEFYSIEPLRSDDPPSAHGFIIPQPKGACNPASKTHIPIEFYPQTEGQQRSGILLTVGDETHELELLGSSADANVVLTDAEGRIILGDNKKATSSVAKIDLGTQPVGTECIQTFQLRNEGPFRTDFVVEAVYAKEFSISPSQGVIPANSSIALQLRFKPSADQRYAFRMKILWDKEPIKLDIIGSGGLGKLDVKFIDTDISTKTGFDFGILQFNSAVFKHLLLVNQGRITVDFGVTTTNDEFKLALMTGEAATVAELEQKYPNRNESRLLAYSHEVSGQLPPEKACYLHIQFSPKSAHVVNALLKIVSDANVIKIPLRGSGGTFQLSHRGDLNFGTVNTSCSYEKSITLINEGTIPSSLQFSWSLVGIQSSGLRVSLVETFAETDPRSKWFQRRLGLKSGAPRTTNDCWNLVKAAVVKHVLVDELRRRGINSVDLEDFLEEYKRCKSSLIRLINMLSISSQVDPPDPPHLEAIPSSFTIPSYGEVNIKVSINMLRETTLLGALVVKSGLPSGSQYEVPLTASAKTVSIFCDGTNFLDFKRQPIGEEETIMRRFKNVGNKDVSFTISHENPSLRVAPNKGYLKVNQIVVVYFTFKPTDDSIQTSPIIFSPENAQPIKFKMFGAGGYPKCSLSKYRRFDFGRCMIGKDTVAILPIHNEGNTMLHLVRFDLADNPCFQRDPSWPTERYKYLEANILSVSLDPGSIFRLPIIFSPTEEHSKSGRLTIYTPSEKWEIELIGLGKEAVLVIANTSIDFVDCIIGNCYEQELIIKNVGDVNYPVSFQMEKDEGAVEFIPKSLIMQPFTESHVIVAYIPTKPTKKGNMLTISSPYSVSKLPMTFHSGSASLEFEKEVLDFGLFERRTNPTLTMKFRNVGTIKTSFYIKDRVKPSRFAIEPHKGFINPGEDKEITIRHVRNEVAQFLETIQITTDLIDYVKTVDIMGHSEESILKHEEFAFVNMGICPVLDVSTSKIKLRNYGKFPVLFDFKVSYPLKVTPTNGIITGESYSEASVMWTPSGAYELKSQLTLMTNIGTFLINVRGKSTFPELKVSKSHIDFGVCGTGLSYTQSLVISNEGKVPLFFNIPLSNMVAYSVSQVQGSLQPKESKSLDVSFCPKQMEKYNSTMIIECRGISHKEVTCVGAGGLLKWELSPDSISLDRISCNVKYTLTFDVVNSGDIVLRPSIKQPELNPSLKLTLPPEFTVCPGERIKCAVTLECSASGPFQVVLEAQTYEGTKTLTVSGSGTVINLSKSGIEILQMQLPILACVDPLSVTDQPSFLQIKTHSLSEDFRLDQAITEKLSGLFSNIQNLQRNYNTKKQLISKREIISMASRSDSSPSQVMELASMLIQFLGTKQSGDFSLKLRQRDEYITEKVIAAATEPVRSEDLSWILRPVEPSSRIDLSLVLARPPPFVHSSTSDTSRDSSQYRSSFPAANRKDRNARTIGVFR